MERVDDKNTGGEQEQNNGGENNKDARPQPMSNDERDNLKEASKFVVGLSTSLISAALTFIAITGAMLTFILTNRTPTPASHIFFIVALIFFVGSMISGTKGIDYIKRQALSGTWKFKSDKVDHFSWQAGCIIVGIVCAGVLPITGTTSQSPKVTVDELVNLIQQNHQIQQRLRQDSLLVIQMEQFLKEHSNPPAIDTIAKSKVSKIKAKTSKNNSYFL